MGKKKKNKGCKSPDNINFQANPFRQLKGFAVSSAEPEKPQPVVIPEEEEGACRGDLFAIEMAKLGVERTGEAPIAEVAAAETESEADTSKPMSDEEEFLEALGELPVRFEDQFPEEVESRQASPGRMKQLKLGRLKPEATLDLHGLYKHQVVEKVRFFLQDAEFQGHKTLLIITGRGLHSDGEPVLRTEVERFLREDAKPMLAEWARAPRQYGGDGALIVFLKG